MMDKTIALPLCMWGASVTNYTIQWISGWLYVNGPYRTMHARLLTFSCFTFAFTIDHQSIVAELTMVRQVLTA